MSKKRAANTYRWHKHGQIKNTVALLREKRRDDRAAGLAVGPRPTFKSVKAQTGMGLRVIRNGAFRPCGNMTPAYLKNGREEPRS